MFKPHGLVFPKGIYVCPLCGAAYNDYDTTSDCIKSHGVPERLIGYDGMSEHHNCSNVIYVELSDGRIACYVLHTVEAEEKPSNDETVEAGEQYVA